MASIQDKISYLPAACHDEVLEVSELSGSVSFNNASAERSPFIGRKRNEKTSKKTSYATVTSLLLVFTGICVGFTWLLSGCLSKNRLDVQALRSTISNLVKDAVPSPAATPAVLNVFQVYQPVLTPSGATDETISSSGVENTAAIGQVNLANSCQLLLMNHTFR